jgi:hypothetical protein
VNGWIPFAQVTPRTASEPGPPVFADMNITSLFAVFAEVDFSKIAAMSASS